MQKPTQNTKPVVECNHNDTAKAGKQAEIVGIPRSVLVGVAVYKN